MLQSHYLSRTGLSTLATLQAVGMQIADSLAARVVGRELHRADAGTLLALHLTGIRHVDIRECLDEEHHKQAETEGTHKPWNRTMG